MVDPFGRHISYLRVSVTDRCDFRCVYCMAEDMTFLPKADLLTLEEMDRLCSAFVAEGVRKLRLTGGEPLVRKNVMSLIRQSVAASDSRRSRRAHSHHQWQPARQVCGRTRRVWREACQRLDRHARSREVHARITRWGELGQVLDGMTAANAAGIKVKINTVALKGVNDDEVFDLIDWARARGPRPHLHRGDADGRYRRRASARSISADLAGCAPEIKTRYTLDDIDYRTGGPARYVRVAETGQRVGFITPLTHNFCESCNRVRLTCTGTLFMCLGQDDAADLRAPLARQR